MSQFSESYHFRGDNQKEVVNLLKSSKHEGYILPAENGWVTFVVKDSNFEPLPSIVHNNHGVLLHYLYAEDHGWSIRLFEQDQEVSQYACDWDDEVRITAHQFDLRPYVTHGLLSEQLNISELLYPSGFDELFNNEPYYKIAQALGLTYYDWVSYHYVEDHKDEDKKLIHVKSDSA